MRRPADEEGLPTPRDVATPGVRWRHANDASGSLAPFPSHVRWQRQQQQQPTLYFIVPFDCIRTSERPRYACAIALTMGLGTMDDDDRVFNGRDETTGLRMYCHRPELARMADEMS